jgi:UDP-N-acetyl-D-glucosamine dehydrogenase
MSNIAPKVVIVGLGCERLPLEFEALSASLECIGFDTSADVTDRLNAGHSHVDDVTDIAVQRMLAAGVCANTDPATLSRANVIAICVPTPLAAESLVFDTHGVLSGPSVNRL